MLAPLKNRALLERDDGNPLANLDPVPRDKTDRVIARLESEVAALSTALRQSRRAQRRSATISTRKIVSQLNEISGLKAIVAAQRERLADFESGQVMIELGHQLQQLSASNDDLSSAAHRVWQLEKTIRAAHAECERLAGERDELTLRLRHPLANSLRP
jgi:predicted  nucleic acid-binding Zn-ribbon protein